MSPRLLPLLACAAWLLTSGCGGTACESYLEALQEKARTCNTPAPPSEDAAECSEESEATAERLERCVKASSCETFRASTFAKDCLDG